MHLTREELANLIESIGTTLDLPTAYYQFNDDTAQAPPFLVWFISRNADVFADDENYVDKETLNLELYTSIRDFDLEAALEAELKKANVTYYKEANFVDDEKIWQIAYESEVIINGNE